ncbi:hypothetical protein [Paenibacillus sonchi]|nr:hypothetical protein [Paenibacillus sonchi]
MGPEFCILRQRGSPCGTKGITWEHDGTESSIAVEQNGFIAEIYNL